MCLAVSDELVSLKRLRVSLGCLLLILILLVRLSRTDDFLMLRLASLERCTSGLAKTGRVFFSFDVETLLTFSGTGKSSSG